MSYIPMIMLAAGTAVKAISQIRQGQSRAAAEEYNAKVAEAEGRATQTRGAFQTKTLQQQSDLEESKIAREKGKTLSTQRVKFLKSGVRLEGSPLEVMADTAAQFELDLSTQRYNTQIGLEEIRYETDLGVSRSQSEATFRRLSAKRKEKTGYYKAGSTILSGGYQLAKSLGTLKSKKD